MSTLRNVLEEVKLVTVGAATSTGTTQVDSSIVDMAQDGGYDGVLFFTTVGSTNAGNFLQAQQGQVANLSDAATIAGSRVQINTNGQTLRLNIPKVAERYIRCNVVRAGATTVVGEIYALLYRTGGPEPVPAPNSTAQVTVTVNPGYAEGTP